MSAEQQDGWMHSPGGSPPAGGGVTCILTLSGDVVSSAGDDPAPSFAAAAGAMARDAERAARHLGFGRWEAIVVESTGGVLGFAPSGRDADHLAVVGLPRETPAGAVQRAAARVGAEGIRQ